MKTKIEINYQALGKASALVGFIAALVLFLTWDLHSFAVSVICCVSMIFAGIGIMTWAFWKIDKMEHEHDEIYRGHLR